MGWRWLSFYSERLWAKAKSQILWLYSRRFTALGWLSEPLRNKGAQVTYGIFRTSHKFYTSRPPANCVSARQAWDVLIENAPIVSMRLIDGEWFCERGNGDLDSVENTFELERRSTPTSQP